MFYLACLDDWPAWMSVHHVQAWCPQEVLGSLELELRTAEGYQVRAGDQTQVLNHRAISFPV